MADEHLRNLSFYFLLLLLFFGSFFNPSKVNSLLFSSFPLFLFFFFGSFEFPRSE